MAAHRYFTAEQEKWLRENYSNIDSYDLLTALFNHEFCTSRSKESIREKCTKRMGLNGMANPGAYGKRQRDQLPIGTIRRSQTGTYIKVLAVPPSTKFSGYSEPYWLPLQKKVYQDAHGEIANGKMVCFLDGNTSNFDLDNLYCIDRKISAIMSKNGWWTNSKDITLTAIKWCELHYAIKEVNSND